MTLGVLASVLAMASPLSSSPTLFQQTVVAYCQEAIDCHRPRKVMTASGQRGLAWAIQAACDRVWPCAPERLEVMFALKLTETYVGPAIHLITLRERTHGHFCLTTFEAREAALVMGITLPRDDRVVSDLLVSDIPLSAMLSAWTLSACEHATGDRVRGLLCYKYGPSRLAQALASSHGPPTELGPWRRFAQKLAEVRCIRERIQMNAPKGCGCLAP